MAHGERKAERGCGPFKVAFYPEITGGGVDRAANYFGLYEQEILTLLAAVAGTYTGPPSRQIAGRREPKRGPWARPENARSLEERTLKQRDSTNSGTTGRSHCAGKPR